MGAKRKRGRMFQYEIEQTERRRSSRIIALEEKKEREREKKALALALARKNNSANHVNKNKGKAKATIDVGDHLEDEQHGPTKKERKCKALLHLISSTQEGQRPENGTTSRTNVSSSMPEKHVLEFILDILQRKDPHELFAEPVNPDVVENYYRIVKQPMDFGTMRAKLHEGMYTNLEQFKRDVYLICSNAMNANPATTAYHKVAEAINSHARRVFEGLSADPEHFDLKFSLNKRRSCRKPQGGQSRTSRHAKLPPKPAGRNNATRSTVPEIEKRDMYWPPSNKSLLSEFLNASKPNIQLNKDASNYQDSLLRFVEDLGPTAQKVAARKLEALKFQQLLIGDTPTPNPLENVSGTEIIPQPTPQAPTEPDAPNNANRLSLALPLSKRPLTIPGIAARENRNVNTIAGAVNIRDGAYKVKEVSVEDGWDACAAALLGNVFHNCYKGKSSSGLNGDSPNGRGTMDIWSPSKEKMVSPFENVSSLIGLVEEGTNQNRDLQLGANLTGKTGQWNTSDGIPDILNKYMGTKDDTERSSRVITKVWPTRMISGPQPKPLESICGNSLSDLSFIPQPRQEDFMSRINDSGLSLVSQPRPADSMPSINLPGLSLFSQPMPADSMPGINLSGLSLVSQPRPADSTASINLLGLPLLSQPRLADSMSGINLSRESLLSQLKLAESMSSNNHSHQSILPSQAAKFSKWTEPDTCFYGLGTSYQPGDFQALLGSTDLNNSPYPVQASHDQILNQAAPHIPPATDGFYDLQMQLSQLDPLGPFPLQEPQSSSALEMSLGGAMNYYGGGSALIGQPEEATPQLLWDDDQQPNLALQL